jgi:hypothetical protein
MFRKTNDDRRQAAIHLAQSSERCCRFLQVPRVSTIAMPGSDLPRFHQSSNLVGISGRPSGPRVYRMRGQGLSHRIRSRSSRPLTLGDKRDSEIFDAMFAATQV